MRSRDRSSSVRRAPRDRCRAAIEALRELAWSVAELLLAGRRRRGTPGGSRVLACFWRAVLGLRWFRGRAAGEVLARGHGISRATACRYLDEVMTVLAGQAPGLREALERARDEGLPHVVLDGTVIACDRCKEPAISVNGEVIDLWYSGKAHCHGGRIQAVTVPDGFPLRVREAEPGAARHYRRPRPATAPPPAAQRHPALSG
jgi:hypothetical protein